MGLHGLAWAIVRHAERYSTVTITSEKGITESCRMTHLHLPHLCQPEGIDPMSQAELLKLILDAALAHALVFDLSRRNLTEIPAEIGQHIYLLELDLSNNQLISLPAEIGQLTCLEVLNLKRNQLSSLPVELGQLTNLKKLHLADNPLTFPPPKIIKQGTDAILAYLREQSTTQY